MPLQPYPPSLPPPLYCRPAAHQQQAERPPLDEKASRNVGNSAKGGLRGSGDGKGGQSSATEGGGGGGGGDDALVDGGGVTVVGEVDGGLRAIEAADRSSKGGGWTVGSAVDDGAALAGGGKEKEQHEVCVFRMVIFVRAPPDRL